jgi:GIY-YIG catalytic domain
MLLSEIIAARNSELVSARETHAIRLVRHKDRRTDLNQLYAEGKLEIYQSYMSKPWFHRAKYVISFLGLHGRHAKFIGVFEVGKILNSNESGFSKALSGSSELLRKACHGAKFHYQLSRIKGRAGLDDLRDRLVIDWGGSAISWCQKFHGQDKEIWEIRPPISHAQHPFQGYYNVCLPYSELRQIVTNRSNREWHDALSEVAGVYLILDTESGKQYVGSAYGRRGILGRWQAYARNPHGGNKQLKTLLSKHPGRQNKFQFALLKTLEKDLTKFEVIEYERFFKQKLGSKVSGLNSN